MMKFNLFLMLMMLTAAGLMAQSPNIVWTIESEQNIHDVAFSPDDSQIIAVGGAIEFFDVATQELVHRFMYQGDDHSINLKVVDEHNMMFFNENDAGEHCIIGYDVELMQETKRFSNNGQRYFNFSVQPHLNKLMAVSGHQLTIWNYETTEIEHNEFLETSNGAPNISNIALTPDGRYIITSERYSKQVGGDIFFKYDVVIRDANNYDIVKKFEHFKDMALSNNGQWLAIVDNSKDGKLLHIYNINNFELLEIIYGDDSFLNIGKLKFNHSDTRLLYQYDGSSQDKRYNVETLKFPAFEIIQSKSWQGNLFEYDLSNDDAYLVATGGGQSKNLYLLSDYITGINPIEPHGVNGIEVTNSSNEISIKNNSNELVRSINIIDMDGKPIKQISTLINNDNHIINGAELPTGVYIVQVITDNHTKTEKIIISK